MTTSEEYEYYSFCPQCEEHSGFNGEVIESKDGSAGAEGLCPRCGTYITQILRIPTPGPKPVY
ncbi:hypothetical protein [Nonomuraea cavernae]|uniref:hypothetical protein n=1 Tax=Nonomuraea cavernae TaxID=2045107 RepID=UPI0033D51735